MLLFPVSTVLGGESLEGALLPFMRRNVKREHVCLPPPGEVLRVAVVVVKESQGVSILQPGGVSTVEAVCLFLLMSAVTG